jgi:phage gp29-like protein
MAIDQFFYGYTREIIALMEQSETDSYVIGTKNGRIAGFQRDWRVTPFSESATDKQIATFAESVFLNLNMRKLFRYIFDAKMKSYSVIELEWNIVEQQRIITSFNKINQKYFRIDKNDNNKIKIDNAGKSNEIPEDAALVCQHDELPILIGVLRDYILKEFGLESWASFIEIFGEAFVFGKYPPGSSPDFKKELEEGINAIAASTKGILPEGANVEITESGRTTGDHQAFIKNANLGIAITILGHANAAEDSQGLKVGDNQSAFRVRREIAVDDIIFIEECVTTLMKLIIDKNFTTKNYPVFSIDKSEPINVKERIQVLAQAFEQGYKINPDEYAKLGIFKYPDQEPLEKETGGLLD